MECKKNDDDPRLQVYIYRLLTACITCINIKIVLKKIVTAESSERKSSARASIAGSAERGLFPLSSHTGMFRRQ
jgi:hypothetical protein